MASVIIDGAPYFRAFAESAIRAEKSLWLLCWDFNPFTRLWETTNPLEDYPEELGPFLYTLLKRKPHLEIRILLWPPAIIYRHERDSNGNLKEYFSKHPRLYFELDTYHPLWAAHHQKIVLVDNRIAFCGGLDLSRDRWDTREHQAIHPERFNPQGEHYRPFHDIQMVMDGETVHALSELFIDRWRRCTGESLPMPEPGVQAWPPSIQADFRNPQIAISRTEPAFRGRAPVKEIEQLYLDSIRAAKKYIYFEHQYFVSTKIEKAIAERLRESDGPEIVFVGSLRSTGWIEEGTMGTLRNRLLSRLKEVDKFGRFRAYYPTVPRISDEFVSVHAKLFIVDGVFLRVGSSNLSNRSLAMDTECDLSIETESATDLASGIERVLFRLLGEHLGQHPGDLAQAFQQTGSLIKTIEAMRGKKRTLLELPLYLEGIAQKLIPDSVDIGEPLLVDRAAHKLLSLEKPRRRALALKALGVGLLAVLIACIAMIWRSDLAQEHLTVENLAAYSESFARSPYAFFWVLLAFVGGGLILFPVILLILVTAFLFDPLTGFLFAFSGSLLSAVSFYGVGRLFKTRLSNWLEVKLSKIPNNRLQLCSTPAVAAIRLVPILPFTVFNVLCGVLRVPLRHYVAGTVIGMVPGIFTVTALNSFSQMIYRNLHDPMSQLLGGAGIGLVLFAGMWLTRMLKKQLAPEAIPSSPR